MRQDDHEQKRYFRSSDRVFRQNGAWYFTTREGDEGPYVSEGLAQREVDRFITDMTELAAFQATRVDKQVANNARQGLSLELVALDDRPHFRPTAGKPAQRRVHI